ncbi:MAG: DUF1684 domain-containing protein [Vicinamibacterales bacterium]
MREAAAAILAAAVLGIAAAPPVQTTADPEHAVQVEAFRARHERDYTREYVPLAGLFFLKDGSNTVGSAPGSDVLLPDRAPANVGRIVYANGVARFEPAPGGAAMHAGRPVTTAMVLRPAEGSQGADELTIGDISFWVHLSGERRAIRLRDPQGELARTFAGYHWFPIDSKYRVVGRFIPDAAAREVAVASLTGDDQVYVTEGLVEFTLDGQTIRMRPMTTRPGRFFFIFKDGTSGKGTYEAARFLYTDLLPDGTTVLDFNEAYNPPCAFNPFTTCPLPPRENRLTIAIPAGERDYPGPKS